MRRTPISKPKQPRWRRRLALAIGAIALIAVLAALGWMRLCALLVHVRYAQVVLPDLPSSFDGTTVLYVTDVDVTSARDARRTAEVLSRLQALNPDLLLIGGDFTALSLFERLNSAEATVNFGHRSEFLQALTDFRAPMGKFAVSGDGDGAPEALQTALASANISLIDGALQPLSNGVDAIALAGMGAPVTDASGLSTKVRREQCVIALAHSPEQLVSMRIAEAADGGPWADLVLAGHTHGGLVRLFGRSALALTDVEKRYCAGWFTDASVPLLVSQGLGSEGVGLRLATRSEVWLVTLKAGEAEG